MSSTGMERKLMQAATRAAREATERERARCLWILEELIERVRRELSKKLLVESQRHAMETKLKLAQALVNELKFRIVSGERPPTESKDADRQNSLD